MIKMTNFTVIDIYLQVIDYCVQMYKKEGKAIDLRIENNALKRFQRKTINTLCAVRSSS